MSYRLKYQVVSIKTFVLYLTTYVLRLIQYRWHVVWWKNSVEGKHMDKYLLDFSIKYLDTRPESYI